MLLDHKTSHVCLLDLSAAFDTNDHNIIITHLSSWFGVHSSVVNWIKFYFLSHSLHIKFENELSSLHTFCSSVPRGSVLGPLLFIMYTTPLSSLISSLSLNNHLYVLFFPSTRHWLKYYSPSGCSSADLLYDDHKYFNSNSSKTEFLLIGLKKELAKIHNSSINTTQLAHYLGFIFDDLD